MAGADWPLVGRAKELARIGGLVHGGGAGVVLSGLAGVGKTRLASEALLSAASEGFPTLRVTATQAAAALPLGAFATLLPELTPGADRAYIVGEVARSIAARGGDQRVVLLVDDAHLLDDASAALTLQLALSTPTFVLATVRRTEPTPDAVVSLWKDGLAERLELRPFSPADVEDLLVAALGGPADRATVRQFFERTEGNVLFLRELVLGARELGALRQDGGLWRLEGKLPPSARLVELVEARLEGLAEEQRAMLATVALGEPLGVSLAGSLGGRDILSDLERRRLLRVEDDGRRLNVRLGHPIYGDVLRAQLSPLHARAVSSSLGDGLAATGARRREDVLRLASWRLMGGGDLDPALMLAGAHQAHTRHDLDLAERLARAAWDAARALDAGLLLGAVISQAGRPEEAEAVFRQLAGEAADDNQRAQLAVSRSQNFLFLRQVDEAISSAEQAEAEISDLRAKAEVGAQRALLLLYSGRVHEARDLCASLIPHATGRGLVGLCLAGAYTCGVGGRLSDACRISELGLTTHLAYEGPPFLWPPGVHRFIRIDALSLMGRLGEAERLGTDWYATAVNEGSAIEQAYVTSGLSKTFRRQGRVRTAARWARLSERLFREEGRPAERSYDLIYLAHALALAGSYDEAEAVLGEYDGLPGSGGAEFGPEVLQARAWVCVAGGDLTRATAFLTEAAELARAQGSLATECEFLHDLARLGLGAEVAARLRQVARSVEGPLAPARVVHVDAVISRNPGGLETASQAFEDLGALLLAAEGAADAAVAWRGRREPRKAAAAERRAGLLAERCEGARTPGLIAAPARALLSARELEIARLAAAGIPNKEIAARLYLSVRTVENKLHTAYEKLGVDGRAELAEALEGY